MNTKSEDLWSYTSSSTPIALASHQFASIVIVYDEAYAMLQTHTKLAAIERNTELDKIFECLVLSYFSRYESEAADETHNRYYRHLLEDNDLVNFEHTDVGYKIITAIVATTQEYLPGYTAHNHHHVHRIHNAEMRSRSTLVLEVDALGLQWFLTPKHYLLGE